MENTTPAQQTTETPINPSVPLQSATTQTPKAPNKLLPILLTTILIAVVGIGGYYLGMQSSASTKNQENLTTTPTPQMTTENPTANWITYSNSDIGFSFKYPTNLVEVPAEEAGVSGPLSVKAKLITTFADRSTISPGTDAAFDGFSIYNQDFGMVKSGSFNDYLTEERNAIVQSPRGSQEATVSTMTAGKNLFSSMNSETYITRYFIQSPDKKRIIIFSFIQKSTDFQKTFEQILSTFSFDETLGKSVTR